MKMGMSPPSFSLVMLAGFLLSGCAAGNYSAPVEDASHAGGPSTSASDSGADADALVLLDVAFQQGVPRLVTAAATAAEMTGQLPIIRGVMTMTALMGWLLC